MKVDLLQHNLEIYENIKAALESGEHKIAVANATGTGKSYLAAKVCEEFSQEKKLVLIPSVYIRDQLKELFTKYKIKNTDFMLYQKLIKIDDFEIQAMDYKIVVLDEYHHNTAQKWGEKVRCLMDSHNDTIFFGTSATPVRSDGVNVIDELFNGKCVSELPLSQAIVRKIVPLPTYVSALYTLDDELERLREKVNDCSNTEEEKKEFYKTINVMRSQVEKSYGMPIVINHHIKDKEGKYLVFCKNKRHLEDIRETVIGWFQTAGFTQINDYVVHSSYEKKEADYKAFCNDTSHSLKLLFCVNMLNEGLHLEDISGVILLRPTTSNIVWHQQIGRAIETNNMGNPVIIDATNNFQSVAFGIGLKRDIKNGIAKGNGGKNFDESDFLDIDTFFITGFVEDVQSMFRMVENKLIGDHNNWNDDEIEILKNNFPLIGASGIVKQNLLPRHTVSSIGGKAFDMSLKYAGRNRYIPNEADDQILIKNYENLGRKGISKLLPHMGKNQIKRRVKHLGLKFDSKKWTKKEDQILAEYYNKISMGELMEKLTNRKETAIMSRASKMELAYKVDWTDAEDKTIIRLYPKMGFEILDKLPNKTKNQLRHRVTILNVKQDRHYGGKPINIINTNNGNISTYKSIKLAAIALHTEYNIGKNENSCASTIQGYLTGKTKSRIYKGKFRFEYADGE